MVKFNQLDLLIILFSFTAAFVLQLIVAVPVEQSINLPPLAMGLIEEPAKIVGVFVLALLFPAAFLSKQKCVIYGVAAGLGFAIMEDIFYIFTGFIGGVVLGPGVTQADVAQAIDQRIILALPGHLLWSALAGLGIIFIVTTRSEWPKTLAFLLGAAALHGVYDTSCYLGNLFVPAIVIILSAFILYIAYKWVPESGVPGRFIGILIAPPNNEILVPDNKVFGRDDFAEYVPFEEVSLISRDQFEISRLGDNFYIKDLGSKAGTRLDGARLKPNTQVVLRPGSKITLPNGTTLTFTSKGAMEAVSPVTTLKVPSTAAGMLIVPPDNQIDVPDGKVFGRDDFAEYLPYGEANVISRSQFTISRIGEQFTIEDMGSRGGTRVNGERIQPYTKVALKPGSKITLPNGTTMTFTTKSAVQEVSPVTTVEPEPSAPPRAMEPEPPSPPSRTSTDAAAPQRAAAQPRQASMAPDSATKPLLARIVAPDNSEISLSGSRKFGRDDFQNMLPDEKLPFISRQQFAIGVSGDRYYIEDLQSNNGTTLNGERLQPGSQRELKQGDEIGCANVLRLKFQV
jgi:pSer/pThr/pTyr-binding forkhead associated (FHA) protein